VPLLAAAMAVSDSHHYIDTRRAEEAAPEMNCCPSSGGNSNLEASRIVLDNSVTNCLCLEGDESRL